ncbi:hypothetical protein J7382_08305 [Shimia sp. R11_0]|uniref:DUF6778 family protein n=1 Tax=Shimia sp. R11_0 TaxID=2821096 RepID=UPI001ADADA9A|nr:DUF6778 family protein [Shimia sp. R11_0]MBO9477531.1 hypothetical protein [Shimia sp. R11_0]
MTLVRVIAAMVLGLGVSACASVETASRNLPYEAAPSGLVAPAPSYQLAGFDVSVPKTLVVSESNMYYPGGDIVWRGEAYGDRHEQVQAIFEESLRLGAGPLDGIKPVKVEIEVTRFHALTEKTRYTVGGVHSISFTMTIIDPDTGVVLRGPKPIKASLVGYGGQKAVVAESRGLTQKYRITQHLARVVREELTKAEGFVAPERGVTQSIRPLEPIGTQLTATPPAPSSVAAQS